MAKKSGFLKCDLAVEDVVLIDNFADHEKWGLQTRT